MKIVIAISDSFCANFIKGQATFLKSKGYEVVIVSSPGTEVEKLALDEKVRLEIIEFSREISILKDLKSLYSVIKFLKKEKPDLVNAGNPKTGFLFMLSRFFFPKTPMVFTLRGLRSDTLKGIKKKIVWITEKISCSFSSEVIVISPTLREHAINKGILNEGKGVVFGKGSSNGVDVDKFMLNDENKKLGSNLRHSLGISDEDIVIGHVGRITKDKGVEELYNAFKICASLNDKLKLILVGPVEDGDPISNKVMESILNDSNVFLLGKKANVSEVYAAYDLFVLFSYREGFGNVALEAAAMSRPVIVSDIPGAKDTVEHMSSGIHVASKNVEELTKALQFYIDNTEIRIKHGEYGALRARKYFSSEVIWNGQYELYKKLINE